MPPLIVSAFSFISEHRASICAILAHSRQQFNSSSVPNILMKEDLWSNLSQDASTELFTVSFKTEILSIFLLSDTLQWTSTINLHSDMFKQSFLPSLFDRLINRNRYFCRSLKTLEFCCPTGELLALICNSVFSLEQFNLSDSTFASDTDVASCLSKLVHLRKLVLKHVPDAITDETLISCLPQLRSLSHLCVTSNFVTDEGAAKWISLIPNLKTLDLSFCSGISTKALDAAGQLDTLEHLILKHCSAVNDDSLNCLETAKAPLRSLILKGCSIITDAGVGSLVPALILTLEELDLGYCDSVTAVGVERISHLPLLKSLRLDGLSKLDDLCCQHLAKAELLSRLETLVIRSQNLMVSDIGLKEIASISTLNNLKIARCEKATETGFFALTALKNLRALTLDRSSITDSVLEKYSVSFDSLEDLSISSCTKVSNHALQHVAAGFPNLRNLDMSYCIMISDAGLKYLESKLSLVKVNISYCKKITGAATAKLRQKIPHLII